jgi:hypothetical protein
VKFNWTVFAVALAFSLVVSVLSNSSIYLDRTLNLSSQMFIWLLFFINVFSFIVSPLLLFASFYFIGRNIDLASNFLSVFLALFLGSWAGHLIGYFSLTLWYMSVYASGYSPPYTLFQFLWLGWISFNMAFSIEFFAGFAALSIAYLVKKRSQLNTKATL